MGVNKIWLNFVVSLALIIGCVQGKYIEGNSDTTLRSSKFRTRPRKPSSAGSKIVDFVDSFGRNSPCVDASVDVGDRREASLGRISKSRDDASLGPFIVRIKNHISHEDFQTTLHATERDINSLLSHEDKKRKHTVTHRYQHVHYGVVVHGFTRRELEALEHVISVAPVTKRKMTAYSWGVDRVNQRNLPLDQEINMDYTGLGVSVYIVDTGLDSNHVEFSDRSSGRVIKNIYSAFDSPNTQAGTLPTDTDAQGHGTHVAGTVGGKTVGISPGANIFGLRVLDDTGAGDTASIIGALDYVQTHRLSFHCNGNSGLSVCPSVVSMSLGGMQ
jgi:subtilisin family serine protease